MRDGLADHGATPCYAGDQGKSTKPLVDNYALLRSRLLRSAAAGLGCDACT
jgi:hypothetical protein